MSVLVEARPQSDVDDVRSQLAVVLLPRSSRTSAKRMETRTWPQLCLFAAKFDKGRLDCVSEDEETIFLMRLSLCVAMYQCRVVQLQPLERHV